MPFLLHLFLFLIPNPALLSHGASVASESQPVKLVVSERCISDPNAIEGQEFDLTPGSPLVLTHRIRLVPSSGSGSCCQSEFAAVNERIEALEREVSELREKCGGLNGGCCTSQQSQGVGCSTVRPPTDECLNDCNDQGRCIDGKCVCFAGFSGPDCSVPDCPGDCSNKGKCINGKCVCDPGFAGPDCSVKTCPNNCSNNGRCVNGKCVCNAGFTGSDCSTVQCPGNCNNKGRCVNGKCVCVAGFTGPDCSEKSCPGNCNNKGRCVDGKCVCNPEFTGPDCSERSCPKNCNNKGRCVNGKCVCDAGFTGLDCSEKSCPRNCNNKGRCVDGKCVCNSGFTGLDCSEKTCPRNCNNKGRCVNGKCVCDEGFTGLDCLEKTCPGNCNNKGRCVDGKCVCNSGFTGLDCSEKTCPGNCNNKGRCVNGKCVCDEGFTGLDCSEKTCPRNCKNKGRCVDGKCVCNPGFTGLDCSEKTCPGNCNNKGRCVNGKCVCNEGFTGLDCSEKTCPGNCKNRGRCVNGKCVCDGGFTGPDCSEKTCPNNCSNKGRCVNGKCVCDGGFTGPDCSEKTCPNNCSNKGRCVNGKCVCDDGFTGPDCSEKTCPGNCNNKGRCVNGQCVCEVGFTGPDCSTKTCLNNCSNRGRCVNGKCVCNPGFAEPDCSECTDGFAGPDCATALIAVSHLSARNITESSVTLFWTPPAVQYNTYHITFTSEKENDQITERVNGGISSYTQVGLAPGQRYIVTIVGEKDGKMGAKSTTTFQTLISGPKNLHVVKTSTTSVIVQWEPAQGQIDRYILSTAPNQTDGSGEGHQEKTLPSGIDSAQIDGLQPGRLYDVSLVAVKDGTLSLPATVQATPGINAGLQDPASRNIRGSDGILSNLRLQNTAKGSSSQYQSGIDPSREKDPETLRNSVEPTVTTERNITAYGINGTKYVRRVLIRHRLLHLNRESNGKALTGNVSLVLGQVSRNNILTNIPDRTAGSSEEVKPLLEKGPKLQEGRFQKHPIQEELQKETLTTPSPSHSVMPSETQDQPTNKLQTPSRDRHHAFTSLQLPPSSNYRYSGGPILSGSSTSLIKGRHLPPPVSSRVSSQKPVQKIPFGNVSFPQSSHPPELDKETLTKTTNSQESDTENTNKAHFPKHKETINKTVPLYNRMPYRGPFPRRPNIGQNRTSTFQQPYRNPIRRPLISRINNTAINRVEPGTFSSNQHVLTPNRPPIFTRQRKNGTVIRLPPKLLGQIKTAGAAVENKSKETNILFPADTDSHPKSELSLSTDKASSKSNAKIQPVSGRSETTILPRVTNIDNDTTLPNHQMASGVIIGRQNALNVKIRPTFLLKRINNTINRLPSRIPALTNVNSTTIYSPFKNNNYKTRLKDSKDTSRDTGTKMFKLPTEGALTGITDTFKGISEGSENATEHINKNQLPRVTSRDPEIPKIATRDHEPTRLANITTTLPSLINHNTESEIKHQRENVPDQNQNKFIQRTKDATLVRLRPKRPNQIKPNTPTFHSGLKESVILPTDKPTAENNYKLQAVAAGLEVSNDNVLPRITTKAQDLSRITSPEQNLTIITSRNQDLLRNTEGGNYLPKVTDKDQDLSITTRKQVASKIIKENVPTTPRKNGTFQPKPHADIEQKSTTIQSGLKDKGPNVGKVAEESTEFTDQSVSAGEEANNDNIPLNITNRDNSSPVQVKPEFHSISQKGPTSNFTATFTMRKKNGTDLRPALKRPSKPKIMPELGNLKQNKESSITIPQNTFNRNRRPPFTLQRKNGTNTRPPPKVLSQLRPDSGRKNSTQDLKLDWSTKVPHPTDTTKSRSPISEVPEDGISEIRVQNVTSNSFIIIWVAPEGRFKNFVIRITEENDEDVNEGDGSKQEEEVQARTDGSGITTNVIADVRRNSSNVVVRQNSIRLLPGSARSYPVSGLRAQTSYSVTLYGTRPGSHSKIHTSVKTTGPEPPSHLSFSDITDTSLSVSWRRPKSSVSGFKVTYIHTKEGEPISVTVDSGISTLALTKLSPGSTYEVTIISVLGLDESDPIKDFIITLPDPPTDLRAINITDTKALLLWRPALATADQYIITYHAEEDTGSNISVKVSGNAVEQQLKALKASTKYRVTISSQLGDQKSSSTHTSFTTASGSPGKGEAPRDLVAKRVTARTAVLSWKPPSSAVTSYKLMYFIKGGERKEVTLNPGVSEHKLKGLHPSSKYMALLQGERGGVFTSTISTEFTTVTLRFPYPSDCSQELLNGELESGLVEIFPGGKDGGSVKVYCDMETDKGGWTVFQRRKDGKTKFFRSWHEYRKGFGDLEGEFWLGNDALHNLTAMTPMNMRVDLRTQNESVYAHYASFSVDTARKHYIVQVSGYSGTAGDSMQYHDKRPFSTFDRDPQPLITRCAMSYKGGWWYRNCHEANLNGLYDTHTNHQGVIWTAWKGTKFSIPFTEMKIRPASFTP